MESAPKIETCNLEDWKRAKNHRRRPRKYKFEFSYVGNDRRRTQKSGTRRENRNAFYLPDSFPTIPDYRGCLRFMVFISRQNLGWSGNCEIPDRLGFSRHMKTRLGKSQTIVDFAVSRPSQILPTYLKIARRLSQKVRLTNSSPNLETCNLEDW